MATAAITGVSGWIKDTKERVRRLREALAEYVRLVAEAQATWLLGGLAALGAAWLKVLMDVEIPWWGVGAIVAAAAMAAQFQAFYRVRAEREALDRAREIEAAMNEIAALRTREAELRGCTIKDQVAYQEWRAAFLALRTLIHKKIERISRAEADTFLTVGNLKHGAAGGYNDEHNALLAVAARDLDHLAELVHGYARFARE